MGAQCENESVGIECNQDDLLASKQPGDESVILIPGNALDSFLKPVDHSSELSVYHVEVISESISKWRLHIWCKERCKTISL